MSRVSQFIVIPDEERFVSLFIDHRLATRPGVPGLLADNRAAAVAGRGYHRPAVAGMLFRCDVMCLCDVMCTYALALLRSNI